MADLKSGFGLAVYHGIRGRAGGWIQRNAWQRGVLGGSSTWLVVFCIAVVGRMLQRILKKRSHTAYAERLPVGSAIVIRHSHREAG